MRKDSSTECWSSIGRAWCEEVNKQSPDNPGWFIMPYTLAELLPDVEGRSLLDLGCGEGRYARELTRRGACVTGVDCSEYAINVAIEKASETGLDIPFFIRNSNDLSGFQDNSFDIVLCSMMLMDCEDFVGTVSEAARVLKPGGRFIASVLHPCFNGNQDSGIGRMDKGIDRKVVVMDYFRPAEWEQPISKTDPSSTVIWRHRTLEGYVKTFIANGLRIVDLNEPVPDDVTAAMSTGLAWLRKVPIFLFWELTK